MKQQISRQALKNLLQAENIEQLTYRQLAAWFRAEPGITPYIPDGLCQVDPRNGDRVLFNSARSRRPHDNRNRRMNQESKPVNEECIVCQGHTTGIVDVADLSAGFTFINKNLYPILFPKETSAILPALDTDRPILKIAGTPAHGLHFLQWTSSYHEQDWHNLPRDDGVVVLARLASLEKQLLTTSAEVMPANTDLDNRPGTYGFVEIIKNVGSLVGGSLSHGHQQIGFSNIIPRRIFENWRFKKATGETFSAYLQRENPPQLLVRDYGVARLVVPYFMRRPYDMLLLLKDVRKMYLHELGPDELLAVADGWRDALRAVRVIMPEMGRSIAYNVITHNGPGAGMYFEILPYTQETGGFEHLGLFVCQADPHQVAAHLRQVI